MANASVKVRAVFANADAPLTLTKIREKAGDLKSSEISMALRYLMRQRYLTRETVDSTTPLGRRKVFIYTYHPNKIKEETK